MYRKYRAKKTCCSSGCIKPHDSKKEAERCDELHRMQKAGIIFSLDCQVKYNLIPSQKAIKENGIVILKAERPCDYIADFVYIRDGKTVIEDSKGMKTADYVIKRKLMKHLYCDSDTIFIET